MDSISTSYMEGEHEKGKMKKMCKMSGNERERRENSKEEEETRNCVGKHVGEQ